MDRTGNTRPARGLSRFHRWRSTRTARLEADFLDGLVEAELEFVRRLPVHLRSRPAEVLAVLVMLAADYRHHAQGWISRRELRRRAQQALDDLDALRVRPAPTDVLR